MTIIETIGQDSTIKVHFKKSPDNHFSRVAECIDAFKSNNIVESVHMDATFLDSLENTERSALLKEVGKIKLLTKVQLSAASMNVGSLALLLEEAKDLEILELDHETLLGSANDFDNLECAIQVHKSLRKFSLKSLRICEIEGKIRNLIMALCSVSTLEVLKLEASDKAKTSFPGSAILPLGKFSSLRELHISNFQLQILDLSIINMAISKAPIETLSLPNSGLGDYDIIHIAEALGKSKLLRLNLSANNLTDFGAKRLAASLKTNKTIKFLNLTACKGVGLQGSRAIADMAKSNPTFERWVPPFIVNQRYNGPAMMRLSTPSAVAA
jgi:hypothetical protein